MRNATNPMDLKILIRESLLEAGFREFTRSDWSAFLDAERLFENAAMQTQNDKDNAANYHRWADKKQAEIDEIENKNII